MYGRKLKIYPKKSYLILGPRGTGKSTWLKKNYPESDYINLLEHGIFNELLANPDRLESY
jgi:predicted AAA+ superfamily ATPase